MVFFQRFEGQTDIVDNNNIDIRLRSPIRQNQERLLQDTFAGRSRDPKRGALMPGRWMTLPELIIEFDESRVAGLSDNGNPCRDCASPL